MVIGIGGGSGAGKSLLVQRLAEESAEVAVVDVDSYYMDRADGDRDGRARLNFDEPEAFDVELLLEHLKCLREGEPVQKPRYSFHEHRRRGFDVVTPAPVILVEGLLTLWWPGVREVLGVKVFVDAAADIRLARRIQRDTRERGRTVDSIVGQYLSTVRPMHERYVEPTRKYADVVVNGDDTIEAGVGAVKTFLEAGMRSVR